MVDLLQRIDAALGTSYDIERELGRGGMAIVFLANDRKHNRSVALKVLRPELAATIGTERFVREVRIAARLRHPHILPLYASGTEGGFLYYTMPWVAGDSLRDRLRRDRVLPIEDALLITRQVASALEHAHRAGLVHRDVKPENILLATDAGGRGRVHAMLSDFGIARAVGELGDDSITEPGVTVGTPVYMSPEQTAGSESVDRRSDVYSLGCVLYEMLAGEPAFFGDVHTTSAVRLAESPPRLRRALPNIPEPVDSAVSRAISANANDRFRTAGEFVRAIDGQAQAPNVVSRGAVLAVVGALMVTSTALWSRSDRHGVPRSIAVIPCRSIADDSSRRYFGDITEDLTAEAARSRAFDKVTPLASMLRFDKTTKSPREIGAALKVDALLYCSYRLLGMKEHLSAELVRSNDSTVLWTDTVEHEIVANAVQPARVAMRKLVSALRRDTSYWVSQPGATTTNVRALHAYNEGRYWLRRFDRSSLERSILLFNDAIALDTGFAPAYLARARAYVMLGNGHGDIDDQDAFSLAKTDVNTARRFDSTSANGERQLGGIYGLAWNWREAERHGRRAIELDPSLAEAYSGLAFQLVWTGRTREALELTRRATEVSPFDPIMWSNAGVHFFVAGQYDSALVRLKHCLQIAPDFHPGHWAIGAVYAELGDMPNAIRHLEQANTLSENQVAFSGHLGYAYGLARDTTRARKILRELLVDANEERTPGKTAASVALVYIGLGLRDSAFIWMKRAADRKSFLFASNLASPESWRVADDPGYDSLLARVGFPRPPGMQVRAKLARPRSRLLWKRWFG